MKLPWTPRTRRLLVVVVVLFVLLFPLVASLTTRARVERSGVDVTATVVDTAHKGDSYLVAFRLPKDVDPDQSTYSVEVERASYEKAAASETITVRVLEGRPSAHQVEGQVYSTTPYVVAGVSVALVLVVGIWWIRVGRRRPPVRIRANGPLEAADADTEASLSRLPDDALEAVGTVVSADDGQVVVDVGDRQVVVDLAGHDNPVPPGSPVRARGPMIG